MFLTNNMTVSSTIGAGQLCWGRNYLYKQKSEIYIAWESGRHGSDNLFWQWILGETRFNNV